MEDWYSEEEHYARLMKEGMPQASTASEEGEEGEEMEEEEEEEEDESAADDMHLDSADSDASYDFTQGVYRPRFPLNIIKLDELVENGATVEEAIKEIPDLAKFLDSIDEPY